MVFKKKTLSQQEENQMKKLVKKPSSINTIGFMALATFFCAIGFGVASMLYTEKIINMEQFCDVMLIFPAVFCIWFLFRGK